MYIVNLLEVIKSLSDPVRLRIVSVLLDGELSVNEIVELTAMGQSRISRHLKILTDSCVLQCRRDGLWAFYSVNPAGESSSFVSSISPFLKDSAFSLDRDKARGLRTARVEKQSRFFDRISSQWISLKRSAIGDIDLDREIVGRLKGFPVAADLGCGTGELALTIARDGHRVIGVDASTKMLDAAAKIFSDAGEKPDLRIGQIEHLPMRDGEADAAVLAMALHHIPGPSSAMAELFRVIRRGGIAVIADYDSHTREEMREKHHDLWLGFPLEELSRIILGAGFIIAESVTLRGSGLDVHIITAKKP
jgi:ArsR family transcriptional regulator